MPYYYGLYLRPDFAMSHGVSMLHRLLASQYGLRSAGRLMPHTTIKGFFLVDADETALVERLDQMLEGWQPFLAYSSGVIPFGPHSIVLDLKYRADGTVNTSFFDLQERAWEAVGPLLDPQDEFSPHDPRGQATANPYHPHISLVMMDPRPVLEQELVEFLRAGERLLPRQFIADTLHLYRFEADWEHEWWNSITWELVHSWHMNML